MTTLLWLTWLILGTITGLFVANEAYDRYPDFADKRNYILFGPSRGSDAAVLFGLTVVLFPLVAIIGIFWLVGKGLLWLAPRTVAQLLPAYRRVQREQRVQTEQDKTNALRKEIDEMHTRIGIPPVDWSGKKETE